MLSCKLSCWWGISLVAKELKVVEHYSKSAVQIEWIFETCGMILIGLTFMAFHLLSLICFDRNPDSSSQVIGMFHKEEEHTHALPPPFQSKAPCLFIFNVQNRNVKHKYKGSRLIVFSTNTILFLPTLSSLGNHYRSRESHYKTLRLAFRTQHKWPVFCDLRSSFSLFPTLSFIPFLNFPSFYIIKKNELSYILLRRNVHNNNNVRT